MKVYILVLSIISFLYNDSFSDEKKDDEIFKRQITDTQKKLKIRKGSITDTSKLLKMGSGDITDTKALLRKTDFPNPEQLLVLKKILSNGLGGNANYKIASQKSPKHLKMALKYIWEIYRIDNELEDTKKSQSNKNLSESR